jgi:hypothetical protein
VPTADERFELQQLVARFANCFDLKDWAGLGECLASDLYTDYSDLRGTPPETMSKQKFVELRRSALHELQTHHLSGNVEVSLQGESAKLKVSMVIYRRNDAGETLNTHCLYFFGAVRGESGWVLDSITQKVFINDGQTAIHKGIVPEV